MKKRVPEFTTDAEAERFVEAADLTEYDLSAFKPAQFEFQAKSAQLNMRLPQALLDAIKERAAAQSMPYTKLVREILEQFIANPVQASDADSVSSGNLQLSLKSRSFSVEGKSLHLTSKQSLLLELLVIRKGMIITQGALLLYLYPDEREQPEIKIIDVFVLRLRQRLIKAGVTCRISTVWGQGYVLQDPETVQPSMPEMAISGRPGLRDKNGAMSRRHGNMLIGTFRKTFGPQFAGDIGDHEKLSDVLHKLDEQSLQQLTRDMPKAASVIKRAS